MEQPFLNQNPNNINQINTVNQGNIYIQENQQQNQPNNPLDMNPPGMISSQENPLNIQQNQLPPPSQNIIPPQPGNPTTQGVINPIPQVIRQNNYYPQNAGINIQK